MDISMVVMSSSLPMDVGSRRLVDTSRACSTPPHPLPWFFCLWCSTGVDGGVSDNADPHRHRHHICLLLRPTGLSFAPPSLICSAFLFHSSWPHHDPYSVEELMRVRCVSKRSIGEMLLNGRWLYRAMGCGCPRDIKWRSPAQPPYNLCPSLERRNCSILRVLNSFVNLCLRVTASIDTVSSILIRRHRRSWRCGLEQEE
jgi:hypothetical protein